MPYTSVADLEAYLGIDLDTAQEAAATALLTAVDAVIDDRTGRRWAVAQQVESFFSPAGVYLFLAQRPLGTIDNIYVRYSPNGTLALLDPTYYTLEDANSGRVYFPALGGYYKVQVTYTPSATLDPRLKLCANMILAHYLNPVINGISMGVKSYSVAGTISVTYDNDTQESGIPAEAQKLLDDLNNSGGFVFA